MTLKELYNSAHEIPETLKYYNKYTWLGFNNIIDLRYLDVNDTFSRKTPIDGYIKRYGRVLLMPNIVDNEIVDMSVRPIDTKESMLYLGLAGIPYGIGKLNADFKYGDYIYLIEGIGDYGALKLIDQNINVLAIRSNGIPKDQYEIYASLTNKIIIIPDNDKAGKSQISFTKKVFSGLGVDVFVIDQFGLLKDSGDLVDIVMNFEKTKDSNTLENILLISEYFKRSFEVYSKN